MDNPEIVVESLEESIINSTSKEGLATPEEIAALPRVAEVLLNIILMCCFFRQLKKNKFR